MFPVADGLKVLCLGLEVDIAGLNPCVRRVHFVSVCFHELTNRDGLRWGVSHLEQGAVGIQQITLNHCEECAYRCDHYAAPTNTSQWLKKIYFCQVALHLWCVFVVLVHRGVSSLICDESSSYWEVSYCSCCFIPPIYLSSSAVKSLFQELCDWIIHVTVATFTWSLKFWF